jgi:hypothetical protein
MDGNFSGANFKENDVLSTIMEKGLEEKSSFVIIGYLASLSDR